MGEEVLSRLNTRRLLWECEKDETPQERMRRGGSTLAKPDEVYSGCECKSNILYDNSLILITHIRLLTLTMVQ